MTHRYGYYHPTEHRFLTAREAAKCQSFPNNFIFLGPITSQWRQIGNAVPPLLGKALGNSLKKMFKLAEEESIPGKSIKLDKIILKRKEAFHYKEATI
jgi:DNA (cytosine-5)-methyltransferase 1